MMTDQSGHKSIDTLRFHPRCRTIQGSRESRVAVHGDLGASTRRASSRRRAGVADVGTGPILRIGDNDEAPTVFAPAGSKLRTLFCELARTCCASGSRLFQNFSTVLIPNAAASFSSFPWMGPVGLVAPPTGWTKYRKLGCSVQPGRNSY